MIVNTQPAFARRLRLSTAGIFAAIILTVAALLAIAVAVAPSNDGSGSSVFIEAPVKLSDNSKVVPASFADGKVQAASDLSDLNLIRR